MENIRIIERILSLQKKRKRRVPVDIILKNGNLMIRSFQLIRFDLPNRELEGMTRLEAYSSLREQRDPVICRLNLDEIKQLILSEEDLQLAS